ncbi:unnamed protein product [Kuraishia capsulata CBS 1993]|uniref:Magnesium transport protein CorA n=1 Tax=Kuraishia capsulata CBS 1993 TaxID=1382522 RepID=W6MHN0_9ASCO|nr:uncharacterized protein KUCA_T00001774001 [Kuraishia capsulata CBS 1993]CDK25804.1 unnamed protein product [Kuraishia capsulata CBS 1993]
MEKVYDSGDPDLPDLPRLDSLESQYTYDDYNFTESSSDDDDTQASVRDQPIDIENEPRNKRKPSVSTHDFWKSYTPRPIKPERIGEESQPDGTNHVRNKRHRQYFDSKTSSSAARQRADWEPGIDVTTTDVFMKSLGSAITVTDYSKERYRIEHLEIVNESHTAFNPMQTETMLKRKTKLKKILEAPPDWSKVRWINVNGLAWDAISVISQHYNLHRLSIEDMVDIPQRTKVDIYPDHMFCCLPLLKLIKLEKPGLNTKSKKEDPPKEQHLSKNSELSLNEQISQFEMRKLTQQSMPFVTNRKREFIEYHRPLSYRKLAVGIEQVSIFITESGSVISFFEHSANDIERAIFNRLSQGSTILRDSCDPSNLLQAILDAIVDLIYPVITAYNRRLSELEMNIMLNPTISHTQELHLMIGELAMLRSEISPTTALVNQLKDQSTKHSKFMSPESGLYFSDVVDHTISFVDNIDLMRNTVENLIAFIFNILSVETNTSMQQLAVITLIFLPLSFLTGYYGMNFESFSDLKKDVSYYWKISVPFGVGLTLIMMRSYCYKFYRKMKHKFKLKYMRPKRD